MGRQTGQSDYQDGVTGTAYSRTATYAANGTLLGDSVSTLRTDNATYKADSSYTYNYKNNSYQSIWGRLL